MNVLFLSPDFVLPADRGLRVRALSQLRLLAAQPEVESVAFLSLTDAEVPDSRLRELEEKVPKVRAERPVRQQARLRRDLRALARFARLRLLHGEPYLVAKSNSDALRTLVRHHLGQAKYDVVYLGYLGMMAYLPDARSVARRARVVLEQHNLEWQIFERLADSLRPPMRQLARIEARATRRFEAGALLEVDATIAISSLDARGFRELAGVEAFVVPPFVRVPSSPPARPAASHDLGYIGHLTWQPNVLGLDWFCRHVWPVVRQRVPDARLKIAGPGLPLGEDGKPVPPAAWSGPGITTVGFVPDLEPLYAEVVAMVAPVVGGSGVRMKLLETMGAGMPTITTADGASGLGVTNGREVLIADRPEDFADSVARVVSDAGLRDQLRQNAYTFLAAQHSEAVAREAMRRALALAPTR